MHASGSDGVAVCNADELMTLRASIDRHDVWGSLPARKVGDVYEIAFGHHRMAAAAEAGKSTLLLDISDLSDFDMLALQVSENSTQKPGARTSYEAVMGAVKVLTEAVLAASDLRTFVERLPSVIETARGFEVTTGQVLSGRGIGQDTVLAYFDKALGKTLPEREVKANLALLKSTGQHAEITQAAVAVYRVRQAEAAKAAEAEALAEQDRIAAEIKAEA
jgi:hypothetical protein